MGLGPIQAIYQARFIRYLENRGLKKSTGRQSLGLHGRRRNGRTRISRVPSRWRSREKLDNLIFVINCNLQRLDGPVRGNGKIIQELEAIFRGAGWNVIKVIWGSDWDNLIAQRSRWNAGQAAWAKSPTASIRNISSKAAPTSGRTFSAPIRAC